MVRTVDPSDVFILEGVVARDRRIRDALDLSLGISDVDEKALLFKQADSFYQDTVQEWLDEFATTQRAGALAERIADDVRGRPDGAPTELLWQPDAQRLWVRKDLLTQPGPSSGSIVNR